MRLNRFIRSIPAILAASVPLAVAVPAYALGTTPYTAAATALSGFTVAGGAQAFARSGGQFVGGVFTGSTAFTASNGSRAMSVGLRLTQAASATAAMAIRVNPAIATASMAAFLVGIVYNVVTARWEYGAGAASFNRYFTVSSLPGQYATPQILCAASAATDPNNYVCHSTAGTGFDANGVAVNTGYCVRNINTQAVYCNTAIANNVSAPNVPSLGTPGQPVTEETWRTIAQQPLPDAVANALPGTLPLPVALPEMVPTRTTIGNPVATPTGLKQPVEDTYGAPTPACPWCVRVVPRVVPATDPAVGTTYDPAPSPEPSAGTAPEKDTCGLPGTPPCKIDETGTDSGNADAKITAKLGERDAAYNDMTGKIENPVKPTALPWSFSAGMFAMPVSSCAPFTWGSRLGSISVDVCNNSLVNTMRSMLAWMLWCITILYVWRRSNELLEAPSRV